MKEKIKEGWGRLIRLLKENRKAQIGTGLAIAAIIIYFAAFYTGWLGIPGTRYRMFIDHGKFLRSTWVVRDGEYSYTDEHANPSVGLVTIDGYNYYFDKKGIMQTGWVGRRYFDAYGRSVLGWQTIDGEIYYFGDEGIMQKGWLKYEGQIYYLSRKGTMVTGWQTIFGKKYRFSDEGVMQMGLYEEDGKTYLLSPIGGEMLTGEQEYEGRYYLMDDQGVVQTGWHNNKYYQEDGTAATGWMTVDGSLRYFDETGNMKTGLFTVDDEEFYTEEDGSVQPGWKEEFYVCRDGLVIRPETETGDYGRLYIHSCKINVGMYLARSRKNYQSITDAEDSALVVKERRDHEPVVADRKSQGFDLTGLKDDAFAYVLNTDQSIQEYSCVRIVEGTNKGDDVVDENGDSIWRQNEGGICTYSSAGKPDRAKVIIAFWTPAAEEKEE